MLAAFGRPFRFQRLKGAEAQSRTRPLSLYASEPLSLFEIRATVFRECRFVPRPPRTGGKFLPAFRRITVSEYVQPRTADRPTAPRSASGYGRFPIDDGAVRRRPPRLDHGAGS